MIAQTRVGAEQSKGPCQGPSDYLDKKKAGKWKLPRIGLLAITLRRRSTSRSYVGGVENEGDKDKDIEEVKEDPGARM